MSSVPSPPESGPPTTARGLDRHDERRRAGVPTVSVLVGPMGVALEAVGRWSESLGRPLVLLRTEPADFVMESLVVPWVDRLAGGRDLIDAAIAWLARRLDQPAGLLGRSLRGMTPYDVDRFFDSAVPLVGEEGLEQVVRRLIELAAAGRRGTAPGLGPELNALLEGRGRPWVRVFRALGELVPQDCLPVLAVAPTNGGRDGPALEGPVRRIAELAAAQPHPTLALIVEPGWFEAYLAQAPESRAKALIRTSILEVGEAGGEGRESQEAGGGVPGEGREADGDRPLPHAGSSIAPPEDEARSAAERFLFDLLEALPETAGLFQLNATLDFPFGPGRPIEIDFLARSLNLVIEVDGYYHFQEPEAYRRDRRKDVELQTRGYLVLRFLAEDVVERLEEILDTILSAVAYCRHRREAR